MKKETKGSLLLLLTAFIWGMGFVAQTSAMDAVEPYTFLGIRFLIGSAVLLPVIIINDGIHKKKGTYKKMDSQERKILILGGVLCGMALFGGAALQQLGIVCGAETGKAGFLTAMYILIVPILGIFLKKKVGVKIWLCVLVAVVGIYFLSVKNGFSIYKEDFLLLACAFAFSIQIMLVDYFVPKTDAVRLSALQFFVVGIIGTVIMFIKESPDIHSIMEAAVPILYAGIFASGAGYTLQVVGQQYARPTEASLIMSLESAFALLGGIVILHQLPDAREYIGMALMFAAIIVSQIDFTKFRKN